MHFIADYGMFLAKAITLVTAILICLAGIPALTSKTKLKEKIDIKKLNKKYQEIAELIQQKTLPKKQYRKLIKTANKKQKQEKQNPSEKKRLFVLHFIGDIRVSATHALSEEITAILTTAKITDEVVVLLESSGGMVHSYGLAASQLDRIKQRHIPLTIIIDKVAASGGYMMACVANKIIAAPFAIIGSIGVIAQLPNFHRLLKKNDIEFEQISAGEYKRTLTLFGENTDKGRKKLQEEIQQIHDLFKQFVASHRPQVDINEVATGEYWLATKAKQLQLVDTLQTSDDYLTTAAQTADLYEVCFRQKKSFTEKLLGTVQATVDRFYNI